MKACLACVLGVLSTFAAVTTASADGPTKTDVVPALQKGGYVLFIRHPKTHQDQADTDPLHMDNVKKQRQLSDEGRKQAKDLGEAFRTLKIPVAAILSSKFWRAQEAARLLELGKVDISLDLAEGGLVVSPNENQRRAQVLRKLLGTAPPEGKNVIIVSHKPNLQDAAGKDLGDVAEAEVVIFQPLGENKSKVMARVPAALWMNWTK
ncbi:MAG TPA: histidine phosphatase family protein [Kofleriaceae bacterium]|nr:histidine phosphatase family protein [Kofleriaceae bacterium]